MRRSASVSVVVCFVVWHEIYIRAVGMPGLSLTALWQSLVAVVRNSVKSCHDGYLC